MRPKEMYLIVYNLCACAGWSAVFALAVKSLAEGIPEEGLVTSLSKVYAAEGLATFLTYSQTSALLEILHAGLGLVRSPLSVTALQVGSRIVALIAVNGSVEAQSAYSDAFDPSCYSSCSSFSLLPPLIDSSMGCWIDDPFLVVR